MTQEEFNNKYMLAWHRHFLVSMLDKTGKTQIFDFEILTWHHAYYKIKCEFNIDLFPELVRTQYAQNYWVTVDFFEKLALLEFLN